jgi:hypothetical protein
LATGDGPMASVDSFLKRGLVGIAIFLAAAGALVSFLSYRAGTLAAEGRASVIVAAIGFLGILFTAAVTLMGLLLKDSVDHRAALLQREAELRLKAETSLKAIEMMTAKGLTTALAAERREGAIIALSSLGYFSLILLLCKRYWKDDGLSPDLVMAVVDECLKSNDYNLQTRAVDLIQDNPERLPLNDREFAFPSSLLFAWRKNIPYDVKINLLDTLMKAMLSKPFAYWHTSAKNGFLYTLYKMFTVDEEPRFRVAAAVHALKLVDHLKDEPAFLPADRDIIEYSEIRDAALAALGFAATAAPTEEAILERIAGRVSGDAWDLALKIEAWPQAGSAAPLRQAGLSPPPPSP